MTRLFSRSREMLPLGEWHGDDTHGPNGPLSMASGSGPGSVSGPALQYDTSTTGSAEARRGGELEGSQNPGVALPPFRSADGRNLYADRPLPPRPLPKPVSSTIFTTITLPARMPARPSTSHGPDSMSSSSGLSGVASGMDRSLVQLSKPNFDQRISRDDMYLTGHKGRAPMERDRVLLPHRTDANAKSGALPTPEQSPGNGGADRRTASPEWMVPPRMPTPESLNSGEIPIGMAIGSPTYQPASLGARQRPAPAPLAQRRPITIFPAPTEEATATTMTTTTTTTTATVPVVQATAGPITMQRQKTQKRKLFGSLFGGKRHSEVAKTNKRDSPNTSDTDTTTAYLRSASTHARPTFGLDGAPTRRTTMSERSTPKHKPIVIESNTQIDEAGLCVYCGKHDSPQTNSHTIKQPFLDVEIPDIRFERYSVMFSGLLNPPSSASSLLARRQATLERLRTVNDGLRIDEAQEALRPRRGTSPQPSTKSPGFTLFPPPRGDTRQGPSASVAPPPPPRPSSHMRSHTLPALLSSPSRPSFEQQAQPPSQPRKAKKTVTILSPRAMDERNRTAQMERLREQHVQMARPPQADVQGRSFPFGPGESGLILDSPSSVDDEADIGEALLLKAPDSHSPQWDMMPAETPRGSAVPAKLSVVTNPLQNNPAHYTSKRSVPASTSVSTTASMSSSSTATPEAGTVRALANESAEAAALMAAVENSIARQISLSREQRRLLRPLQAAGSSFQAASPSSGASRSSPGARNASDTRDGRVSETKSSTPTLIVHDPMNGQHPQHRKSERVVLEEDDV